MQQKVAALAQTDILCLHFASLKMSHLMLAFIIFLSQNIPANAAFKKYHLPHK